MVVEELRQIHVDKRHARIAQRKDGHDEERHEGMKAVLEPLQGRQGLVGIGLHAGDDFNLVGFQCPHVVGLDLVEAAGELSHAGHKRVLADA